MLLYLGLFAFALVASNATTHLPQMLDNPIKLDRKARLPKIMIVRASWRPMLRLRQLIMRRVPHEPAALVLCVVVE